MLLRTGRQGSAALRLPATAIWPRVYLERNGQRLFHRIDGISNSQRNL